MKSTQYLYLMISFLLANPGFAGVVFAPPPPAETSRADENFSESRFGAPPVRPDLGTPYPHTSSEGEDLAETRDVNRRPAGLEFSQDTGQVKAQPIITEEGTPSSAANLNPKPVSKRFGVQEVALIAGDLGFFPKTVFVTRDIPVRMFITGASKKPLCLMMDSFQIRKQVHAQRIEEISFTPTTPGQYRFYCPVNGTEGTLLVKELGPISNPNENGEGQAPPHMKRERE